jgi:glycerate kinase
MTGSPPVVVVAPDSFKGSLSAPDVGTAVARGLRRVWPTVEVRARPMADGGEGTLDAVLAAVGPGGQRRTRTVAGAGGEPTQAGWGLLAGPEGPTAVIEAAQIVGITDAEGMQVPVGARSTRGVGELIRALLDDGIRRFLVGLGGSSTNDGGAGMLAALGLAWSDAAGRPVPPIPDALASVARADAAGLDPRLAQSSIIIMSDVNNPLCGARGATAIFGPQKGVSTADVARYDAALAHVAGLAERAVGATAATNPGAGAAGGLGFALQLIGGVFRSGAEVVAERIGLDEALTGADWTITGEGRSDAQTLLRKGPFVVAEKARARGVPVTLLSGAIDPAALAELGRVFDGCIALPAGPVTLAECIAGAAALLADRAEQIARVFAAGQRVSLPRGARPGPAPG